MVRIRNAAVPRAHGVLLLAFSTLLLLGMLVAARADERRGDDRRGGDRHDYHGGHGWGHYPPPPPVAYGGSYYPPPPVVYGPGINLTVS